ncbi:MAG: ABC transporter ATP-binding protein [Candidatus Omnitrophota bacterium]|nr:MAG: ABC transporter ATP-binding protein [Candidatus Omnitrophota bacterium]
MDHILEIKNLHTCFHMEDSTIKAVEGLSLSVKRGEVLGLVGESACGKTITAHSIMRLIQPPGEITNGQVLFEGKDLLKLSSEEMRMVRGAGIALIFQEPSAALNPLYTVGFQVAEAIKIHKKDVTKKELNSLVSKLLEKVGISNPEARVGDYPHNLSGGQAQRVMIAMALSCNPKLLIADEPTTALDVTIQAQIMDLFLQLQQETKFTLILITHNLALCTQIADRVAIMYAGKIVELATMSEIFAKPLHPYTRALLSSIPHGALQKNKLKVIEGAVPNPASKPKGCHFHPRCPIKKEMCTKEYPEYKEIKSAHEVSCFRANEFL